MPTDQELIHLGQLQALAEAASANLADLRKRPRLRSGPEHLLEAYRRLGHWQMQLAAAERAHFDACKAVEDEVSRLQAPRP